MSDTWHTETDPLLPAQLAQFIREGGGSFRKLLDYTGMDYTTAYNLGWMEFTNALSDREQSIRYKTIEETFTMLPVELRLMIHSFMDTRQGPSE